MCTTAAKKLHDSWFLIKTRDPVSWMRWDDEIKFFDTKADKFKKYIIQNPDPREDGYYGGINEKGVAFVSTFVRVAENQVSYIRRPYVRLILDAKTAKEAIKIIQSFNPRIGGNMFVADPNSCFGIEGVPKRYHIETIKKPSVKTNHFLHLPNRNLGFDTEPSFEKWSHDHQARAEKLIAKAQDLKDLKNILRDRKNAEKNTAICTTRKEEKCFTYSAFIFDTKRITAYYCQGNPLENNFSKYQF
ncbi:MAG: carcinine hydrolase/isopenicillin-N N-acyltransferase family protein [Patescibacteria group bacterium]